MAVELLTIGYERHPDLSSLTAALRAAGVERLIDVRELPLSRRRGFSKTSLSAYLRGQGIEYQHARGLGNPKRYRDLYRSGQQAAGERGYWRHLQNGSREALLELGQSLHEQRTCLLCFEHETETCHRALIIKALRSWLPELEVIDL